MMLHVHRDPFGTAPLVILANQLEGECELFGDLESRQVVILP